MSNKIMYPKLPRVFKRKWIAALRSGKFIQGEGSLKKKNNGQFEYCCLGVAAEVAGCKISVDRYSYDGPGYILNPADKIRIRGITKVPFMLRGNKEPAVKKLANMNDSSRNFNKIADWIDKNL